jgi:hypothetical protein
MPAQLLSRVPERRRRHLRCVFLQKANELSRVFLTSLAQPRASGFLHELVIRFEEELGDAERVVYLARVCQRPAAVATAVRNPEMSR